IAGRGRGVGEVAVGRGRHRGVAGSAPSEREPSDDERRAHGGSLASQRQTQIRMMHAMRFVITGANRGIGLELVRQLLARGDSVDTFRVDALGAIAVTRALLPSLRKGDTRKLVHISTGMASISDNTSGGAYGYRMAKAALNIASKSMAVNLRGERFISVVMNP